MIINISLSKAYELLEKASAIIISSISGSPLMYPCLGGLSVLPQPDNEFLFISWTDDEGYEYNSKFIKENNSTAQIDTMTNELILIDDTNEEVRLSLLTTMKL